MQPGKVGHRAWAGAILARHGGVPSRCTQNSDLIGTSPQAKVSFSPLLAPGVPTIRRNPRPSLGKKKGRNEMDPPLCGSTSMSHNEFTISEPIEPQEASPMKQEMNVLGIDIAKRVFHAVGMDDRGKIVYRKRLSRHDLMPFIAKLPSGAHRHRSLWRRALLGETLPRVWPRGEAHGTAIRQAVRQVEQKRQPRCRGHRGSGDAADHALCADQGRRPARISKRSIACASGSWASGRPW